MPELPDTAPPPIAGTAPPPIAATVPATSATVDLGHPRRIHVIGVGGTGMSAIASVLAAMGHRVTGSDLQASRTTERLAGEGVAVSIGHAATNVPADIELVTRSTAIPDTNPEITAARALGADPLSRADMLAAIAAQRSTVAVAGTHGKTTTSSMLALVLGEAGARPSFIIGGEVNQLGTGAAWDAGEWFVVEADESDGTFVRLPRQAALVTNIEPDHLDHWGDFDALQDAFAEFVTAADGPRVLCADDDGARALAAQVGAITYGTIAEARYTIRGLQASGSATSFELFDGDQLLGSVVVPVAGVHNARNACGAIVMGLQLGASFDAARRALAGYGGVARRFQDRGTARGVTFIDDYAHLPGEITVAIAAARDGDWGRLVCVFQPHRYSRTASLWSTFGDAFVGADLLVLTDVYAAGEAPRPGVSGKLIVDAVLDAHPRQRVVYLPARADLLAYLPRELRPGDLCLTLGAGDLTTLADDLLGSMGASASGAPAVPHHAGGAGWAEDGP